MGMDRIIIIGQEAICPDGLGRVAAFNLTMPHNWIQVNTYFNNRGCKWGSENVKLINPQKLYCERELLGKLSEALKFVLLHADENGEDIYCLCPNPHTNQAVHTTACQQARDALTAAGVQI